MSDKNQKPRDHKYRWVRNGTERLYDVGILADGGLYNPHEYPDDVVRAAVLATDERGAQRRSAAARKAAITRADRRQKKIYEVIEKLRLGHRYGPAPHCIICEKRLGDPESIERGIGSECWQDILKLLTPSDRDEQEVATNPN